MSFSKFVSGGVELAQGPRPHRKAILEAKNRYQSVRRESVKKQTLAMIRAVYLS